ncbi:MAG: MATE family efflux transporter [Clostridia bacterium]|nr:MATE family efflux transporter [Clostridia bacterium]NCD03399.1 MATE family efflux transporter [Clostridia bacterium]
MKSNLLGSHHLLALPLLIGNILQQFYNTIDALIVGRYLGISAFAAIGLSGTIMNLFIFVLNGFCVGISMLFAQFYGMHNEKNFRKEFALSIWAGLLITAILSILSLLFLRPLLRMMQTPDNVFPYVISYLTIILCSLFATYFYNLFSNVLRSVGDTNASLLFLFVSILLNTLLDILFIAVLHMGIAGGAYATVISQLFSACCCYLYLRKRYPMLICRKEDFTFHKTLLTQTLSYGIVSALHQSSLYIGKLLVQGAVNTLGTSAIASYTATMRVEGIVNAFSDSGSQSMSILIAQNHGAGNKKTVCEGFHHGLLLLVLSGILLSAIMFLTSPICMMFLIGSNDEQIIAPGISYLKVISIFYVLCYIGNAFVGFFRGVGKVNIPFIATTVHITLRVILSYLLVERLGLPAVAIATGIGWICVVFVHEFSYLKYQKRINKSY